MKLLTSAPSALNTPTMPISKAYGIRAAALCMCMCMQCRPVRAALERRMR